ncbi:MAG: lipid-A-disaccharide synthase [Oscillatoria sp. PMC 1068.18]|nr:lipid-A-disaccharide synthase [Oscillatoria sp. PMC 1068.18]
MRIFISTGEVSGDLQGALLIEALQRQAKDNNLELEIFALGGDRMEAAGAILLGKTTNIGSVGILESIPFVLPTLQIQRCAKKYLRQNPPDLIVLIDYLSPNLAIGSDVKKYLPQVPIVYYIAPQEWVWSPPLGNTSRIVEITDLLLAIFAAEGRYFQEKGVKVRWVGHPLLDRMETAPRREAARKELGIAEDRLAIALVMASRQQELKYLLPVIFSTAQKLQAQFPQAQFLIPLSNERFYEPIQANLAKYQLQATIVKGKTLTAIAAADLAITKSGTVNLEIALLNVPQVVIYRVNPVTMWLGRNILNFSIPFMSPVNLVLMQEIVPELLQEEATPERIFQAATELLLNSARREQMQQKYQEMRASLGTKGACDRAAKEIIQLIS